MTTPQRNYKAKDVDMLITSSTIIETAIANKTFLQSKRSSWTDPFFDDLKTQADNAVQVCLGIDSAKELRQSTQAIRNIQKKAIKDLAEFKVQVLEDFKNDKERRAEILNQLGFNVYHTPAQKGDQEALINLLYQFKTSMSATLKTEITGKGTDAVLVDNITGYADTLKAANITQETFKGQRKEITASSVTQFNDIYDKVISICKIASKFYKDNPALKDQFNFSKVRKALNAHSKSSVPPAQTESPAKS